MLSNISKMSLEELAHEEARLNNEIAYCTEYGKEVPLGVLLLVAQIGKRIELLLGTNV